MSRMTRAEFKCVGARIYLGEDAAAGPRGNEVGEESGQLPRGRKQVELELELQMRLLRLCRRLRRKRGTVAIAAAAVAATARHWGRVWCGSARVARTLAARGF
jgi:hypothetical protein